MAFKEAHKVEDEAAKRAAEKAVEEAGRHVAELRKIPVKIAREVSKAVPLATVPVLQRTVTVAEHDAKSLASHAQKLENALGLDTSYYAKNLAEGAREFLSSKDPAVRAFAQEAVKFAKSHEFEKAGIALDFAYRLTQLKGLPQEARKEKWALAFEGFAQAPGIEQIFQSEENMHGATAALAVTASRITESISKQEEAKLSKLHNPKIKNWLMQLENSGLVGKERLFALECIETYNKYYNTPASIAEGKRELEEGVKAALVGDRRKAGEKFEAFKREWAGAKTGELVAAAKKAMEEKFEKAIDKAYVDLAWKLDTINSLRDELQNSGLVERLHPEKSQGYWLYRRLDDISKEANGLLGELARLRQGFKDRMGEVTAGMQKLEDDMKAVFQLYPGARFLVAEARKTEQIEGYLMDSQFKDYSFNKKIALGYLKQAREHLGEALRAVQNGEGGYKARQEFEEAAEYKTRALTMLYINESSIREMGAKMVPGYDPTKEFSFYTNALVAGYDSAMAGKGGEALQKLSSSILALENAMVFSDKKIFATREAELQHGIVANSKILIENYHGELAAGNVTMLAGELNSLEQKVQEDTQALKDKIRRARYADTAVEIGASFIPVVGPAFAVASAMKMGVKEYAQTGEISPMSVLMLSAALIGLRGGLAKEAFVALEASTAFKVTEVVLGVGLIAPQVKHVSESWMAFAAAPQEDKAKRQELLEDAIFNSLTLAVPIAHGFVTPRIAGFIESRVENRMFARIEALNAAEREGAFAPVQKAKSPEGAGLEMKANPREIVETATLGDTPEFARNFALISSRPGIAEGTMHNTVVKSGDFLHEAVNELRGNIAPAIPVFRALDAEMSAAEGMVSRLLGRNKRVALESSDFTVIAIDKGKTWLLNSLSQKGEFGDLGLLVFFKSADEATRKLGIEGLSLVKTGADDAMIIISEKGFVQMQKKFGLASKQEAIEFVGKQITQNAREVAGRLGFKDSAFVNTLADFSTLGDVVTRNPKEKTYTLGSTGNSYSTMEAAMGALESKQTIRKVAQTNAEAAHRLEILPSTFERNPLPDVERPPRLLENVREDGTVELTRPKGDKVKLDEAVTFRLEFTGKTKEALEAATEAKGKGVVAVEKDRVGPSVTNSAGGSAFTDGLAAHYQHALETALAEYGLKGMVELYETGPMSFGIKYKKGLPVATLDNVFGRAEQIFKRNAPAELEIGGIRTYRTNTPHEGRYRVADDLFGAPVSSRTDNNAKMLVSALHLMNDATLETYLGKLGIDAKTIEAAKKCRDEKWLRGIEDVRPALLKHGATPQGMNAMFDAFGLPHREGVRAGEGARAPLREKPAGGVPTVAFEAYWQKTRGEVGAVGDDIKTAEKAKLDEKANLMEATDIPRDVYLKLMKNGAKLFALDENAFLQEVQRMENNMAIIDAATGKSKEQLATTKLNYLEDPSVLLLDMKEIAKRVGELPEMGSFIPEAVKPVPAVAAKDLPASVTHETFSNSDVGRILEYFGYELAGRRGKEYAAVHSDGRTAIYPKGTEISGGTLNSMLRDNGITRREFMQAAADLGIITKQQAKQLGLGE